MLIHSYFHANIDFSAFDAFIDSKLNNFLRDTPIIVLDRIKFSGNSSKFIRISITSHRVEGS